MKTWISHFLALCLALTAVQATPVEAATTSSKKAALAKAKAKAKAKARAKAKRKAEVAKRRKQSAPVEPPEESDSSDTSQAGMLMDLRTPPAEETVDPTPSDSEVQARSYRGSDERVSESNEVDRSVAYEGRRKSGDDRTPAITLDAGPQVFGRSLTYTDDIFENLVTYNVAPAMAFGLSADWFPAAHFTEGFIGNLGLTGNFNMALGLRTRGVDGTIYSTAANGFDAGVKVRIPFGNVDVGAVGTIGNQQFTMGGPELLRVALPPDVSYSFVRTGLFGRVGLGSSFDILGHFDYLFVSGAGMIKSDAYFPRASVGGIDAGLGLAFRFSQSLGVSLNASLRRYFYSMNSVPGDASVAGGAIDQYPSASLRLTYQL